MDFKEDPFREGYGNFLLREVIAKVILFENF